MLSRFIPVIIWLGVIFFFSAQPSLPGPEDPLLDVIVKKLGHVTEYAILMLLLLRALAQRPLRWQHALVCLAAIFLYGLSDEYHQSFTAGRTPLFTDVLFDSTGGLIGLLIWRYAPRWGAARAR